MKTQFFKNGGVRHLLGWFGLTYTVIFLMHKFGMFPSFFETEKEFQVIAPAFVSLALATLFEWYVDYKASKAAIRKSGVSYYDVMFSVVGTVFASIVAISLPTSIIVLCMAVLFITFAYIDRKINLVANLYDN